MSGAAAGRATPEGTRRFAARFAAERFRDAFGLRVSPVGLGTYLGAPDDATDAGYREAVAAALAAGLNVLDTAVNYRAQRSERAIGRALAEAFAAGHARRDEIVVATKGGYVPWDGAPPRDPRAHLRATVIDAGLARPDEVVAGCHCLAPGYLRDQLGRSLANLGLAAVDVYYLHNVEQQLGEVDRPTFARRMRAAFEFCEQAVAEGRVGVYGTATWDGYRAAPDAPGHLELAELMALAREVGGPEHHFRAVQLPVNLAMTEALTLPTQTIFGAAVPLLQAAARLGVTVMASAPILQGRLARKLPAEVAARLGDFSDDGQRALQFARSAPGVTTALLGSKTPAHVAAAAAVAAAPPLDEADVRALFERRG